MAQQLTPAEAEKALKRFKSSYEMYERTKKSTMKHMKEQLNPDGTRINSDDDIKKEIELIETAQNDILEQYKMMGGNPDDIVKKTRKKAADKSAASAVAEEAAERLKDINTERSKALDDAILKTSEEIVKEYLPSKGEYNPEAAFDVIPLPSKGECYREKLAKMPVAFLTAYDENMIISPNLYKDNLILDYLIKEKVLNNTIDPMDLLEGDREAIILFLRASGYGNEYPITATDEITGKEFDVNIDLSQLKYKDFTLKGDVNGWFTFKLPVSGKEVQFRFPTHRDNMYLKALDDMEDVKTRKGRIRDYVAALDGFIEADDTIARDDKIKVRQSIRTIESWGDKMDEDDTTLYKHTITNKFQRLIMSVDGVTDRDYINSFIKKMNVRDSAALRRYMTINEPGVDYTLTITKPESLGGGSMEVFLQFDQYLFLNLPE